MKKIIALLICFQMLIIPAFADYDFSDEAQAEFDRQQLLLNQPIIPKTREKNELKNKQTENRTNYTPLYKEDLLRDVELPQSPKFYGSAVSIPAGTSFDVMFDSGVSSGSMSKDDRLTVRLVDDLKYNGQVVAPAGSLVYGVTTNAQNAGYAYGSGAIELNFNEILTPDGTRLTISTKKIVMKADSERAAKMTRDVVVGALGSLVVGALFTALGGSHDWGKNMLIYGGIGAVGGGIHGAMQRGEDVQIPDGTMIKLTLTDILTANPYNNF